LAVLAAQARWTASHAVCTHERIAARARAAGFGHVECIAPGLDVLVKHLRSRRSASIQSPAP
jgi:hypothetical protein